VRRCWRFGQKEEVNVYIILSEREINILENIKRKQKQMDEMQEQMTSRMKDVTLAEIKHTTRITTTYKPQVTMELPSFMKGA
jgi:SNF2 family DNA or RNA helicase